MDKNVEILRYQKTLFLEMGKVFGIRQLYDLIVVCMWLRAVTQVGLLGRRSRCTDDTANMFHPSPKLLKLRFFVKLVHDFFQKNSFDMPQDKFC